MGDATLTPGSFFGGEIGSGAFVDGKLVVVSNVGDPATNAPTNVAQAFALDPATGEVLWQAEDFAGMIFAPVGAVPGVAFVGTDTGLLAALDTQHRCARCGRTRRPPGRDADRRSSTDACSGDTASSCSDRPARAASSASRRLGSR